MKTQTEELQKELEKAELEMMRAIDRVKDIKAKIAEAEKEPSIYELMPIGSVWCGWEVERHDKASFCQPIGLKCVINDYRQWPTMPSLHKLIAEQKRLDAMKRAADAATCFYEDSPNTLAWMRSAVRDYKEIIEKEGE
jgi:hypothetical protein